MVQKPWEPYLSNHSVYAIGTGFGWLSVTTALGMGLPAAMIGTIEWLTASCLAGAVVGLKTDVLQQAAPHIIKVLGWDLDSMECWKALCEAHAANAASHAVASLPTTLEPGTSNQTGRVDASASGTSASAVGVEDALKTGRVDMSIGAAVDKGLSNENFDLTENLRRGDERSVDPAIFVMEKIMAEQGCDFDTARLIYNRRKIREAEADVEADIAGFGWGETPPVAVVYHQADGMIPYQFASLAAAMQEHGAFAPGGCMHDPSGVPRARAMFEMKLRGHEVNCHMYPLSTHPEEWAGLLSMIKRLLAE